MNPDYTILDQLSPEEAFKNPARLVEAIKKACPEPQYYEDLAFEYGRGFDVTIIEKLNDVARYAQTQPLKAYETFESKLMKISMQAFQDYMESDPSLMNLLGAETITRDAVQDVVDGVVSPRNPAQRRIQDHLTGITAKLSSAMRHALCRLNPALQKEIQAMADAREEEEAGQEEATEDFGLSSGEYDPEVEALEEGLEDIFSTMAGDLRLPGAYHMVVMSGHFLALAEKLDVYADGKKAPKAPDQAAGPA